MEYRVSRFPMPSRFLLTANEKDFSLALEMTVWESYAGTWLSLLPMAVSYTHLTLPTKA